MRKGRSVCDQEEAFDGVGTDNYLTSVKRVIKCHCLIAKCVNQMEFLINQHRKSFSFTIISYFLADTEFPNSWYMFQWLQGDHRSSHSYEQMLYAKELYQSSWKPWMPTLSNEPDHAFTVLNSWPHEGSIAVRVHKNRLHRDGFLMNLFIFFPHKLAEYKYGIDFACLTVVVMETIQVL